MISIPAQQQKTGGAARQSTMLKALKAEREEAGLNVCMLHTGDATTGTLFYTLFEPETDAQVMNTMAFDAFTVRTKKFGVSTKSAYAK